MRNIISSVLFVTCIGVIALTPNARGALGVASNPTLRSPQERLLELETQRDASELTLVGLKARREAILQQMQRIEAQAGAMISHDRVIEHLQAIADARIKTVDTLKGMLKAGMETPATLEKADIEAAEAQIQVAERREALAASAGGGILPKLNEDLARVEIDTAEKEAVLKYIENKREEIVSDLRGANAPASTAP